MPFSSGTFSRLYNWVTEQLSSPIEISKLDAQEEDFATALSNCLLRDGTGLPTAAQDWNGQNLTNVAAFTATGIVTGGRFVPTSSSVPTNGLYLSAANTPALASNSTLRWSVNSTGNHVIAVPSSGLALAMTGIANGAIASITDGTRTLQIGTDTSNGTTYLGTTSAHGLDLYAGNAQRVRVSSSGNVTISAPSSGTALSVGVVNGAAALSVGKLSFGDDYSLGTGANVRSGTDPMNVGTSGAASTILFTNGQQRQIINSAGNVTINAPSSGTAVTINGVSGANAMLTSLSGGASVGIQLDTSNGYIGTTTNHGLQLFTNGTSRVALAAGGAVTISAPSSGVGLTVNGVTGTNIATFNGGNAASTYTRWTAAGVTVGDIGAASATISGGSSSDFGVAAYTGGALRLGTDGGRLGMSIAVGGNVTVAAPTSGVGLTVSGGGLTVSSGAITGDGSGLTTLNATNLSSGTVASARVSGSYTGITAIGTTCTIDGVTVGFRSIPRSTTTTTAAVGDVGKCIAASAGITIPNATFAAGDALSIYNDSASAITITQGTSLTLRWGGTTSTGNRSLAARGMCTIWFNSSSEAIITGSGLS